MKLIKQEGFKDCGPTCLLMIIRHYKGNIQIEKLKELCKTTKSGTTAYHLIEAAKKCGFESNGYKCDLKDLNEDNIILPCIAHVIINNSYKHYVVIEKINFKKKKIYIKDPIGKNYIKTFEEFENIYQGILIYMYPIKNIVNYKNSSSIKFLFQIIKPSINQIFSIIIISIFITIFSILGTFYMQYMINNDKRLYFIFASFIILSIFKITSNYLRGKLIASVNRKINLNLSLSSFNNIIHLPYHCYKNNTTGEIVSRINDLENIKEFISKISITVFIDIPLLIISLIIIYFLSTKILFLTLIVIFLYIVIYFVFRTPSNNYISDIMDLKSSYTSYMVESINAFDYIKGCNKENKILNIFTKKYIEFLNKLYGYEIFYNIELGLKEFLDEIGYLSLILIGMLLILDKDLNIANLFTISFLFTFCINPLKSIIDIDNNLKHSIISIQKLLNLYYEKENSGIIDNKCLGNIEFKNLSYTFNNTNYILKNINLKINQGNKVIVLGKSGSGKSTLFKILKKYYDVERDKVYINDIDINDYKNSDVLYVSQNEFLYTDTIYNNIDSDDILNISKICLLDDIIKSNSLGYNALIEENGFNLSGGQRQRIILARTLANDFNIIIIDEGLNQVDTNMERKILLNMFKEYKDKTIIYISHRKDNIDLFNQVIKLEDGVIID